MSEELDENTNIIQDDATSVSEAPTPTQGTEDVSFNLSDVEEAKAKFDDPLEPGTYAFVVTEIKYEAPEEKDGKTPAPYIAIRLDSKAGKHEERFYMSDAAKERSLSNFKHFVRAVVNHDDEIVGKITTPAAANSLLAGKKVRIRLKGDEELSSNGNKFMRVGFSWPPFAEPIEVGKENSKLKAKKIKFLPVDAASSPDTGVPGSDNVDDLPF